MRTYKIRKEHIIRELEIMLDSKEIELEDKHALRKAIQEFKDSKAAFPIVLITAKNQAASKAPLIPSIKKPPD